MKTIYVLRHAKAAHSGDMKDHQRPLTQSGIAASQHIGAYFKNQKIFPQKTLCSTALRTQETLQYLQDGLEAELPAEYTEHLYLAEPQDILKLIGNLPDEIESVLLIGHNPGMHQFSLLLAEEGNAAALHELEFNFPTAALAIITSDADHWKNITAGSGFLKNFITPQQPLSAKTA